MMQNTRKVALVTGAARRIGADIARILHQNEMNVVLHYNTSHVAAKQLCAELNAIRDNSASILPANLSLKGDLIHLVDLAVGFWGRLDVLVNNASQFYKTPVGTVSEIVWDDLINTNLKAPFFLSQAALPHLAKHQGCIVNIADIHAERPMADYSVYCISKAGLIMMTKSLAKEFGRAIRVNAVSPGPIIWPEKTNELSEEIKQKIIERTALKREGSPNEVAKAVLYFVRDADYVTGQVLTVDAGRSLFM
jgi:pteridine reductase